MTADPTGPAESLPAFLKRAFPGRFTRPFDGPRGELIESLAWAARKGGRHTVRMPRGAGATALADAAALWAVLGGHRRFVCILPATGDAAEAAVARLHRDAANGAAPGGWAVRRAGRTVELVSPAGRPSFVRCVGIREGFRGLQVRTPAGEPLRPDLVLIDSPFTAAATASPTESARVAEAVRDAAAMAAAGVTVLTEGLTPTESPTAEEADELYRRHRAAMAAEPAGLMTLPNRFELRLPPAVELARDVWLAASPDERSKSPTVQAAGLVLFQTLMGQADVAGERDRTTSGTSVSQDAFLQWLDGFRGAPSGEPTAPQPDTRTRGTA